MPANSEAQRFRNEDLVLKVSSNIDRTRWDESQYEPFVEELCGDREYQKQAIFTALRYWLSGNYLDLKSLAKENFDNNRLLQDRYGAWTSLEDQYLQFPNKLAASIDLATGTGKSYVIYGVGMIMLAVGIVDRVLVLCPSTTIEAGLLLKFRELASNTELRDLLPSTARLSSPHIIDANQTIVEGSICVENYHAILEHVNSSVRDSLRGNGLRTAVINDESHHVANEPSAKSKKWKEFLTDPDYDFRYILGTSGTCYVGNDYFADVIYRYSLRQAMEQRYVKKVEYIADMPPIATAEEKWQLIWNRHTDIKRKLKNHNLLPLSIVVTARIARCKDVAEELKAFLVETEKITEAQAAERVLAVYNGAPDVVKLPYVDSSSSKVEWVISVSMLNEGWDVKRVFQIVPHEEKAFNSKLLIAQVLGRGLRIPNDWKGQQPEVTVFNHDAWAVSIRSLVSEILEIERRLSSDVVEVSSYNFDLHNIEYALNPISVKTPMTGHYNLFEKGYIELPTELTDEVVSVEFERAGTEDRYKWQTKITHKTYTPREIAVHMYRRMEEEQDPEDDDPELRTYYTDNFPVERLEQIVIKSLSQSGMTVATDSIRQKFLAALGPMRRKESESVRYTFVENPLHIISTKSRQSDSISIAEIRSGGSKIIFVTSQTPTTLKDEQTELYEEIVEPGSGYRCIPVPNLHDFKTPLNLVIADSDPERRFISMLLQPINLPFYDAWIKSTATRFYEISYAWKKRTQPKRGKFNPDFFIKSGNLILVAEIKGNEEIADPSEENRKKNEYAVTHFERVNRQLEKNGSPVRYKFNFLTPQDFGVYFQYLREANMTGYRSELDIKLLEDN